MQMHTWEVNRIAVGGCAKAVAEALRKLGKVCTTRWVNLQCEAPLDVRRTDYYGAFWRWFEALFVANRDGAEFLHEDLCARVQAMRDFEDLATGCDREQLARCNQEHSDIISAALLDGSTAKLKREIMEAIVANRRLLAMIVAREAREARAA